MESSSGMVDAAYKIEEALVLLKVVIEVCEYVFFLVLGYAIEHIHEVAGDEVYGEALVAPHVPDIIIIKRWEALKETR